MHILTALLTVLVLIYPVSANADSEDTILSLPDGQVILSISATERREVEQDLLVATLQYTAVDMNAREVQNEINKAMKETLELIKKDDRVKVNTGTYNMYERNDPRTKERKWHGSQSVTLKSKDADAVLKLTGKLQDMKFNTNGLSYTLDPKTAESVQDSLMEDALKQLQTRAERAAKALGKSSAELRDVNVQGNNASHGRVHHRAMAMDMEMAGAAMAAPVAASGESTITLTVSARAILKP